MNITCPNCSAAVSLTDPWTAPGFTCPHCRASIVIAKPVPSGRRVAVLAWLALALGVLAVGLSSFALYEAKQTQRAREQFERQEIERYEAEARAAKESNARAQAEVLRLYNRIMKLEEQTLLPRPVPRP
jgi:DNA-directed RNA polymerase subunit RPC12/RpoP